MLCCFSLLLDGIASSSVCSAPMQLRPYLPLRYRISLHRLYQVSHLVTPDMPDLCPDICKHDCMAAILGLGLACSAS